MIHSAPMAEQRYMASCQAGIRCLCAKYFLAGLCPVKFTSPLDTSKGSIHWTLPHYRSCLADGKLLHKLLAILCILSYLFYVFNAVQSK